MEKTKSRGKWIFWNLDKIAALVVGIIFFIKVWNGESILDGVVDIGMSIYFLFYLIIEGLTFHKKNKLLKGRRFSVYELKKKNGFEQTIKCMKQIHEKHNATVSPIGYLLQNLYCEYQRDDK